MSWYTKFGFAFLWQCSRECHLTKGDVIKNSVHWRLCLFTDQEPQKQVCIQLHLLTSPELLNVDVEWPFGKVRFRNRLDLQHRLPPSPCSDLSLCYQGRISLRIKWKLSTLIWLRRTRFLRGAVVFITSLRFPPTEDFLKLGPVWSCDWSIFIPWKSLHVIDVS